MRNLYLDFLSQKPLIQFYFLHPKEESIFLSFFPVQEFSVIRAKAFMFQNLWISVWYFNPPFSSLLRFKSYSHPWLEHLVADNRNVSFICFTYHLTFSDFSRALDHLLQVKASSNMPSGLVTLTLQEICMLLAIQGAMSKLSVCFLVTDTTVSGRYTSRALA